MTCGDVQQPPLGPGCDLFDAGGRRQVQVELVEHVGVLDEVDVSQAAQVGDDRVGPAGQDLPELGGDQRVVGGDEGGVVAFADPDDQVDVRQPVGGADGE